MNNATVVAAFMLALLAAPPASSQQYPLRPVRIVVPLAPGGGMDTISRALGSKLADSFGQTVIIENRMSAGGQAALEILHAANADGHTLMIASLTAVTHPLLYGSRFDLLRDFAPISQMTAQGYVLAVHPNVPANTVAGFVQHLKANPGKLSYASSGTGSPIHLAGELFLLMTGTSMTHVPYKGMAVGYTDMIAGRVEAGFPTIISSVPHIQAGRLRALAVTHSRRVAAVPDVPTFSEAGVKGVVVISWFGLFAPAATPKPLVERISREVRAAMHSPDMQKRLAADGSEPVGSTPKEFADHIRAEIGLWSRVIKQTHLKHR